VGDRFRRILPCPAGKRRAVFGFVIEQRFHFTAERLTRLIRATGLVEKSGSRLGRKLEGSVKEVLNPLPCVVAHIAP